MTLKLFLNLVFIIFLSYTSFAQEEYKLLQHSGYIEPEIFITTDKNLNINDVQDSVFQRKFTYLKKKRPIFPNRFYWYKIDFSNVDLSATDSWLVRIINYSEVSLYYQKGDSILLLKKGEKWAEDKYNSHFVDFPFTKENLIGGKLLYVRIMNDTRYFTLGKVFYTNQFASRFYSTFYTKKDFAEQIVYILFVGAMLIIIAYFWGIYFMYKDKLFIRYLFYLSFLLLYLGSKAEFIEIPVRTYIDFYFSIFHELIQVAVNIFYLMFAAAFLKARTDFPKLYIAIRYMVKILLLIMGIQLILMFSDQYYFIEAYVMKNERYMVMLFSLWAYYYIIKHYKDQLVFFLLIGSFFYLVGGLCALIFHEVGYMMLGAILEVFLFSLGVGYRMKRVEEEKKSIENEMTRIELTALKAQMNPHFIFNSLNSIRAYVISNEIKKASGYITKFSKLIRLILHYSSKENITLHEEMDAIKLYVQLEELRFREDFGFEFKLDEKISPKELLVPPLILQPYVENAIRHGLAPKTGRKKLDIFIHVEKDEVEFKIRDNGVGRQFSEKSMDKEKNHKSVAMELTKKRINLTKAGKIDDDNIIVIDLMDNDIALGTEVIIKLPLNILP